MIHFLVFTFNANHLGFGGHIERHMALGADEPVSPVIVVQAWNRYALAAAGMDKSFAGKVDADMINSFFLLIGKEDEVAGFKLGWVDFPERRKAELVNGAVR